MNEKNIIITTTDLKDDYETISIVFATVAFKYSFHKNLTMCSDEAFEELIAILKMKCEKMGGDAIIGCQLKYSNSSGGGSSEKLSASGTIVKLKSKQ